MPDVAALFDDWASRFARGEEPDLREYLARAGEGADELARLVDAFAAAAPAPEPPEERVALMRAWASGESPLLELRTRRGVRRDDVVEAILGRFGIAAEKREKVARSYHQLEAGLLDPRRVDRRLWETLAELLRARVSDISAWRPPPAGQPSAVYLRAPAAPQAALRRPPAAAGPASPEQPDEVDRLFRFGS